ncbi:hypothetical protein Tco_0686819 [Tanacetum coccineum]
MECVSDMEVKAIWGNYNFDYLYSEALGYSGGILCVWDPNIFQKSHHTISDNFVATYGTWIPTKSKILLISIYAPQSEAAKRISGTYVQQPAKGLWAIEGDENSKFYHGIINRKRSQLSIKGIMVDGVWVDDPSLVKDEFRSHFAKRFQAPGASRSRLNFQFPNRLNTEQAAKMEGSISHDEIRIGLELDFCAAVDWFFLHSAFAKGCNSSFIALIPKTPDAKFVGEFRPITDVQTAFLPNRQILDGPFIVNEVLSWCKFKQKQAMVFKVDFAKAYDSVRWDFLDDVLEPLGFGFNGFVLWFCSLSPINLKKSNLLGFGVSREMVNDAASSLGCAVMRAPFKYLGVMVGGNMSMVKTWDETRFWKDHWIGDAPLYDLFPRLFSLEMSGDVTVATKLHGLLSDSFRRPVRGWFEGQQLAHLQNFVKNIRCLLDEYFLPNDPVATRWVKFIPIKINVFAWRVYLDRLPTRLNLNRRNIQTYMSMVESDVVSVKLLRGMVVLVQGYSSWVYS